MSLLIGSAAGWSVLAIVTWQPKTMIEWLVMTFTTTGATLLTIKAHTEWRNPKEDTHDETELESPDLEVRRSDQARRR
jgi:hypothetical protein